MLRVCALIAFIFLLSCKAGKDYPTTGSIEKLDPALDSIIIGDALPEIIADGFTWSEGPLWLEKEQMLIFSDAPHNRIYQWSEAKGLSVYLEPSGYTDTTKRGGEVGSNGLTLDNKGRLIMCQHGNRQIARMDAPLADPAAKFIVLANRYDGKKLNSPNDLICDAAGNIYFTDPPYGLEKNENDPAKELAFQGVYKITTDGRLILLTDTITRPNGLIILPDHKTLIVANSDPAKPNWYAFTIQPNDTVISKGIWRSNAGYDKKLRGLPDGLKADKAGHVFASGPGGIFIMDSTSKILGKIKLEKAASNVALSADEKTLYITNHDQVLRFKMRK